MSDLNGTDVLVLGAIAAVGVVVTGFLFHLGWSVLNLF